MGSCLSSDPGGVTHITDVTKVEKEHIVFDWTILDFDSSNLNFQAKSSTFQAGERLGRLSQWYLALNYAHGSCGYTNVGLFLETAIRTLDRPNDITARINLELLDSEGKITQEFGQVTKTFRVPFFGGPQEYLDCYEWKHAVDLDMMREDKSSIIISTVENSNLYLRLKMEIQGKCVSSVAIRGPVWMKEKENAICHQEYAHTRALWNTKENTDCIIKCQSVSINAHMNILSSRSRVFASMLKPECKTRHNIDKENGNRIILPLDNIDPVVLESMLRYIYIGNLDGIPWNMDICAGLIKTADQFELYTLKNSCFIKLIFGLNTTNAGDIAVFAHNNCASNEIKCQISDFIRLYWYQLENMDEFYQLVQEQPLAFAFFHLPVSPAPPDQVLLASHVESTNDINL